MAKIVESKLKVIVSKAVRNESEEAISEEVILAVLKVLTDLQDEHGVIIELELE